MPKKIKTKRATQSVRRNSDRRKNKKGQRLPGDRGPKPSTPAVISNSVFALTLRPKNFADVVNGFPEAAANDQSSILYNDLLLCYNKGAELLKLPGFIPSNTNAGPAILLTELVKSFKENFVPKGFSYNIDEHVRPRGKRVRYHFTVFDACAFPDFWHFFEVKPIVTALYREDKKLHDLFLHVLKAFVDNCGIPTWFGDGMLHADCFLEQHCFDLEHMIKEKIFVDNDWGYNESQLRSRFDDVTATIKNYQDGEAYKYKNLISEAPLRTTASLLKSLKNFSPRNRFVKLMKSICDFMLIKGRLTNFCYQYAVDYETEGLSFYNQVTLIWDWTDHLTEEHRTVIDSSASGLGVFSPTIYALLLHD